MKTLFLFLALTGAAFAQSNMTCTELHGEWRGATACEFSDGRANVFWAIGEKVQSTWYSAEEWAQIRAKYIPPKKADPEEVCKAKGGTWSNMRFKKCKLPKT